MNPYSGAALTILGDLRPTADRVRATKQLADSPDFRRMRVTTRTRWWALAVEAWPPYAEYQAKTDRQIPVVVLELTR